MGSLKLEELGARARAACTALGKLGHNEKSAALLGCAGKLRGMEDGILEANRKDLVDAQAKGMKESLIDRLTLNHARLEAMAQGLTDVAAMDEPVGEYVSMKTRPNGLVIGEKRVPIGVVGMIYESRPNVTADCFALCFKSGNAVILKGGSDALRSNKAIVDALRLGLREAGVNEDCLQLIEDTNRETATAFMKLNQYLDVLIPRGGAGLIRSVVENATVPTIETGTGNCHVYVDASADLHMALEIITNAKTQRIGVCNACESLVIHRSVLGAFLPLLAKRMEEYHVEVRADDEARALVPSWKAATEEDYGTEYLDWIVSLRTVGSCDEAIGHINRYNTKHSETIVTNDYANAQRFLDEIDAAAVYVNASTRFTDGFEFGFGAEIGISTQKLHARGPMGLKALTTTKFVVYGNGQVRG
ncbi:MAG: glutamate-5-semialdehyde dehydrogenase [Lachnospiraceae bacterium]|jgi:glutamate-5-semialdehyde dehydrogenase|nr:glutamate-5-semialdehyde dehydrogenase [Lachnospiraceae bacterium]